MDVSAREKLVNWTKSFIASTGHKPARHDIEEAGLMDTLLSIGTTEPQIPLADRTQKVFNSKEGSGATNNEEGVKRWSIGRIKHAFARGGTPGKSVRSSDHLASMVRR